MIKDRLLSLPNEVEKLKLELISKQQGLEDIRSKMRIWELATLSEITNEVDEKGKAKYSNDTKRQAELQNRKESSEAYKNDSDILKSLEYELGMINIRLEKLFNEQGNLRAICRLGGDLND